MKCISVFLLPFIAVALCISQFACLNASADQYVNNDNIQDPILDHYNYQLTDAELALPTDQLVDKILEYPYLVDLTVSSISYEDAYRFLYPFFNGFAELENRTDAAITMFAKSQILAASSDTADRLSAVYLNILLTIPVYSRQLRNDSNSVTESAYFGVVVPAAISLPDGFALGTDPISTLDGVRVPYWVWINNDYSDDYKVVIAADMVSSYGVQQLGEATLRYNCHSYAWYLSSTSNRAWMEEILVYLSDSHCVLLSSPQVGAIVVYRDENENVLHSAIITQVNGGTVMCKSKWGPNGVFLHNLTNVPPKYQTNQHTLNYDIYCYKHTELLTGYNAYTHTHTCTICGQTRNEAHIAKPTGAGCKICAYNGVVGVIPTRRFIGDDTCLQKVA